MSELRKGQVVLDRTFADLANRLAEALEQGLLKVPNQRIVAAPESRDRAVLSACQLEMVFARSALDEGHVFQDAVERIDWIRIGDVARAPKQVGPGFLDRGMVSKFTHRSLLRRSITAAVWIDTAQI